MSSIEKVAFIATMLIVVFITTSTNIPTLVRDKIDSVLWPEKGLAHYYIFEENFGDWTGEEIILPDGLGICRLWPRDTKLVLSGYWTYSDTFDQWIVCN